MLYNFPLEIQRLIYSYDSTYKERMKESFIIIKKLPISENYMNIPLLLNIQEISDDALIVSNGSFINVDDDDYYNESIDYEEIEKKKLKRLNDGASIVLDDENSIKKILRSNLLREYGLDGWGLETF